MLSLWSDCCFACEAVAQTPREAVRPFVRVGSENGHLIRHGRIIRREVVAHGCSRVPFPRAHRGFSETALCDSLHGKRQHGWTDTCPQRRSVVADAGCDEAQIVGQAGGGELLDLGRDRRHNFRGRPPS
jgi:hypothetical protein